MFENVAEQPKMIYFGEVDATAKGLAVGSTSTPIIFHNEDSLVFHNGDNVTFHLYSNPDTPEIMGDVPRTAFFGEADV